MARKDTAEAERLKAEAVAGGLTRIEAGLGRLVAKGRFEPMAHESASARLTTASDLAELAAGADVVIEAAVEELTAKQAIFRELDRAARARAGREVA